MSTLSFQATQKSRAAIDNKKDNETRKLEHFLKLIIDRVLWAIGQEATSEVLERLVMVRKDEFPELYPLRSLISMKAFEAITVRLGSSGLLEHPILVMLQDMSQRVMSGEFGGGIFDENDSLETTSGAQGEDVGSQMLQLINEDGDKQEEKIEDKVNDSAATEETSWEYSNVPLLHIYLTNIDQRALRFSAQIYEDSAKIEQMTEDLRQALCDHPPLAGSYSAKEGDLCVAQFSLDGRWYRAKVESVGAGQADVVYIDYGSRESVEADKLAQIPGGFAGFPAGAKDYNLALTKLPNKDHAQHTLEAFRKYLYENSYLRIHCEYKIGRDEYVTVYGGNGNEMIDIGKALISDGFVTSDPPRVATLFAEYKNAEDVARKSRKNIWEYGDFAGNDK